MFSHAIERALRVAVDAHQGQVRKGADRAPYVVHPMHVALILARWGQDDDVIVAGLLHDVAEDAPDLWPLARIDAEFGHHIARIVGELTEDKDKSWDERKRAAIDHVPHMSPQAATVKAADKLHNLQSLAAELRASTADEAWARFRGGREKSLQVAQDLVEALAKRVEPRVAKALRAALKNALDADAEAAVAGPR